MSKWQWEMKAELSKELEPLSGYGNQIFIPEVVKALIGIMRKYAARLIEEER